MGVTRRRGRRRRKPVDDLKAGEDKSYYVGESFWRRL
jgi:hypothetical protein